jgi:DNA-binding phage protein
MALTRSFKETVLARVQADPAFRDALLKEGIESLLAGDVEAGKAILRDYINATVGFQWLGEQTGASPKSLLRMFGPNGNPQARNLFAVIGELQRQAGVTLRVTAQSH